MSEPSLEERARRHAALGDPARLAIIEDLLTSDRTPLELQERSGLPSNALAYHLDVLETAGLILRCRSTGDGRRRYVCLRRWDLPDLLNAQNVATGPALFICTQNSARSPLAAALWRQATSKTAMSAGTHPAERIHRSAVAAGRRAGVDLSTVRPRHLDETDVFPALVVTVCDRAHEELDPPPDWLHWSLPDPVEAGTRDAFDATVRELRDRITALAGSAA